MRKCNGKSREKRNQYHELSSLKEENRILRAEIKRLNRTIRVYATSGTSKKEKSKEKSREAKLLEGMNISTVALASSSYFKYLLARFSAASVYFLIQKITKGFRRFKLFSTVIRVTSSVIAILGTSAFFIFISGMLIFLIPLFLLICAAAYLTGMLFRKKAFKELDKALENKSVFILFPSKGKPFEKGSRFDKSLDIIPRGKEKDTLIITVSPFLISGKGFGGKGYFPVLRKEKENIYILRRNAFFALRKRLQSGRSAHVTYIY